MTTTQSPKVADRYYEYYRKWKRRPNMRSVANELGLSDTQPVVRALEAYGVTPAFKIQAHRAYRRYKRAIREYIAASNELKEMGLGPEGSKRD